MFFQGKTYATRDGRMARIYAIDGGGECPLHGAVFDSVSWIPTSWKADGSTLDSNWRDAHPGDLVGLWEERQKRMLAWICESKMTLGVPEFHPEDWTPAEGLGHSWRRAKWLDEPEART